jgi:hypothetical protein|tara:strand:- start:877 stop:2154 length:1278 start_codon:yes stop_codon:yes gene_type:complete
MILNKNIPISSNKLFSFLILFFFFIPYFIDVYFKLNSITIPLFIIATIINFLFIDEIQKFKLNKNYRIFLFLFLIIIFISSINSYFIYNNSKPIKSYLIISIFCTSIIIFNYLTICDLNKIIEKIKILFLVCIVLGWYSYFFEVYSFNYSAKVNNIFPFQEPSHFALAIGNLSIPLLVFTKIRFNIFILLNLFVFSLIFPSTVLLIYSFLNLFIFFIKKDFHIIFRVVILIVINILLMIFLIYDSSIIDFEYFINRIYPNYSYDQIYNISNLTYRQGWDFAFVNLKESYFLGIGFQMMGSEKMHYGDLYNLILNTSHSYGQNLQDGSFVMSKFLTEFGIIGLFVSLLYIKFIISFLLKINKNLKYIHLKKYLNYNDFDKIFFSHLIIFAYSVNYFIRGINYFTPQSVILIAAILFLINSTQNEKK